MDKAFISGFTNAIRSAEDGVYATTCSRWSSRRRIMGPPFAGPYGWKYHPWVRGILDSSAAVNVSLKSAQSGFTEIGINRALWQIDVNKRDVLYVLPTANNAGDFSKARFGAALSLSPYLKSIFTSTNTVGLKQAGATNLYIRGSRGDSNLKSIPVSVLVLDEYDEMDQRSVRLALERMSGQLTKEAWLISTPTVAGYGVSKEYLTTTQEHFVFQCTCCSKHTTLRFPDCLEVCGETVNDPKTYDSFLKCAECKGKLPHETKFEWLAEGQWQPTYTNGDPSRRGFQMNQLYSSTVNPQELAVGYLASLSCSAAAQEWNNSKLGLGYIGESNQVNADMVLQSIREHSTNDSRPLVGDTRLFTMGYDQGKTGYYVVVEWFLPNGVCVDVNANAIGRVVDYGRIMQQDEGWSRLHDLMREWQVKYMVADADPEITDARRFCKSFFKFAGLSRYRGNGGKELSVTEEDTGAPMITSDRTHWLGLALGRFMRRTIELPTDLSQEFKEHMQNEVKVYERDENNNPKAKYKCIGPSHYAHALCYAEQALPFALTGGDCESITAVL